MDTEPNSTSRRKFLFNVDVLIESESNGRALEKLLHLLNSDEIQDYLVKEGIQLGKTIEIALRESISKQKANDTRGTAKQEVKPATKSPAKQAESKREANPLPKLSTAATKKEDPPLETKNQNQEIWDQFQKFKKANSLIRLSVVKSKGVRLSLPCRILNVDTSTGNVSVYHVDEKQVYLFEINEIEDFSLA